MCVLLQGVISCIYFPIIVISRIVFLFQGHIFDEIERKILLTLYKERIWRDILRNTSRELKNDLITHLI